MQTSVIDKNWEVGTTHKILESIHQKEINIAIYDRDIDPLTKEIDSLRNLSIELRSVGDISTILNSVTKSINSNKHSLIIQDIRRLLQLFKKLTGARLFRLRLATVNTNMCRRFHTDINSLRMLCTYSGPGTLWLEEDNVNREALNSCGDNECIVLDESKIQQANAGSVVVLKGALYSDEGIKAIVHRSPTIEESDEKRLLLRIDTHESLIPEHDS